MHISERETELPEAIIGQLIELAAKRKGVISLSYGEPDFDSPKPVLDYASKIIHKASHYSPPSGLPDLKSAIVKKLHKENKIRADENNIIVTCGSQEALLIALACTLDVSEQVIVSNPGFLGYVPTIQLLDIFPVSVKIHEEENWELNPDEIRKSIDPKKTKAIIVNSPSNPTGNVLRKKILEEIADIAIEYDLWIFSDEAYEKIVYNAKHISPGSLNGMNKYTITMQTFSKSYAMPGFRLGYACVPDELATAMIKSHMYTTISAPTISQMIGVKALSLPKKYVDNMVSEYKTRRDYIIKRLNEFNLHTIKPEGAFYAFSNISEFSKDSVEFCKKLLKSGIAVIPGSEFGSGGEVYIRFSYATNIKLIEKAMDRIEMFLRKIK